MKVKIKEIYISKIIEVYEVEADAETEEDALDQYCEGKHKSARLIDTFNEGETELQDVVLSE